MCCKVPYLIHEHTLYGIRRGWILSRAHVGDLFTYIEMGATHFLLAYRYGYHKKNTWVKGSPGYLTSTAFLVLTLCSCQVVQYHSRLMEVISKYDFNFYNHIDHRLQ